MNKEYKFNTLKARLLETSSSIAGIASFGFALTQLFNPILLGAISTLVVVRAGFIKFSAKEKPKSITASLTAQHYPNETKIIKEIARKLNLPRAPQLIIADNDKSNDFFGAQPNNNTIIASAEALKRFSGDNKKLKYIFAHEASHIKTDKNAPTIWVGFIKRLTTVGVATSALLITAAATIAGFTNPVLLPVITTKSIGLFISAYAASSLAINFASRTMERRADRNALYATRSLEGATSTLHTLHSLSSYFNPHNKPSPILEEALRTHPSYHRRIKSLTKAFNEVSKYPEPQAYVENTSTAKNKPSLTN